MRTTFLLSALVAVASFTFQAGEKKGMPCFPWTPVEEATPADWDAFYKASDLLPKRIKGLTKVWYGKLQSPLSQTSIAKIEPDNFAKLRAGQTVTADITRTPREYGMCMQFVSAVALKAYDDHPFHK